MIDLKERYLDLALEEVIGRRSPPDLSPALLRPAGGRPGLAVAAALLFVATILGGILGRRPEPPQPGPSALQEEGPVIPPTRTVTLDFRGGTVEQAVAALSAAAKYPIMVEPAVARRRVPAIRLKDVPFLEAMQAIASAVPGMYATAQPADPAQSAIFGETEIPAGYKYTALGRQFREGVSLQPSIVQVATLPWTLGLTLDLEPSHRRFRYSELEILEIKDETGAEPELKERTLTAPRGSSSTVAFLRGLPERLTRLRVRARLVYLAEERRVPLTAGPEPRTVEQDGLRITTTFHPDEGGVFKGDEVRVKLEPLGGDARTTELLTRISSFYKAGVSQLFPVGVSEKQIEGRGRSTYGNITSLSCRVQKGRLTGERKVELVLPVEVATRTLEFDFQDLELPR